MDEQNQNDLTRRKFIGLAAVAGASLALAACGAEATTTGQNVGTTLSGTTTAATTAPTTTAQAATTSATSAATTQAVATTTSLATTQPVATTVAATTPAATAARTTAAANTTAVPTTTAAATTAPVASLPLTPTCSSKSTTIAVTEGPYFKPNSPERASLLEAGVTGTKLTITGYVLSTACQPVKRALVDFWQADAAGQYDNTGFKLRGHVYTDDNGRYTMETIVPGLYPGRTRHIHVKAQAPSQAVLTSQLFFPNEPGNARDGIFNSALLMEIKDVGGAKQATFNFVVKTA